MRRCSIALCLLVACGGPAPGPPEPAAPVAARLEVPEEPELPRLDARVRQVHGRFRGDAARAVVAYADRFFRVRGNEGYQKSLEHVRDRLREAGLTEVHTRQLGEARPSWTPRSASLTLLGDGGGPVVAFANESEPDRATLLVGSDALEATELELVGADDVRRGESARGKVVLTEGSPREQFAELVERTGAAGLITRNLESYHQPDQHPDAAQFGYLPPHGRPAFGFSVGTRDHAALTAALARGPARVRVEIAIATREARATAIEARVAGADPSAGAVVFVAHVDEPGANDNGSGVGALCELAIALHGLIADGTAPRPHRPLVFLWGQEMEVSRTWLAEPPMPVAAGLVLDMVGEDPSIGAPFLIERMPDPGAIWLRGDDAHTEWGAGEVTEDMLRGHFLNDLLAASARGVSAHDAWLWRTNPFEGGSDHVPFLRRGLPAVLGWHFTDDAYHTTRDRMDRVSDDEMRRVAATFGAAALTLASDDAEDAAEVIALLDHAARARLTAVDADARDDPALNQRVHQAWVDWYAQAYESVATHYGADTDAPRQRWLEETR